MSRPLRTPQPSAAAPPTRQWIRRVFPLADGVTYAIAAGALAAVWLVAESLESLAAHLAGAL